MTKRPEISTLTQCYVPYFQIIAFIYLPVECGEQACRYDNSCIAEASGFVQADCMSPAPETMSPTQEDTMSNTITPSENMTFNGSMDPSEDAIHVEELACPAPGVGVCCKSIFSVKVGLLGRQKEISINSMLFYPLASDHDFVVCGAMDCEYRNPCVAQLAGFAEIDCTPNQAKQIKQAEVCPTPGDDGICGE